MEKIIKIKGLDVKYDIDKLTSEVNEYTFEDGDYPHISEGECGSSYSMDEDRFNSAKKFFLQEISGLDSKLERLFNEGVHITKAGKPAKNRKNVILESDIITSYWNEYGSHQYDSLSLVAVDYDTYLRIELREVSFQESF